jgi:hypothetical protein
MFKVAVGVGVLWAARAAVAEPYPEEVTDRPVVLNPGMTEVVADEEFSSTSSGPLRNHQFNLAAGHAFGPVELDVSIGYYASLEAQYSTGAIPGDIYVAVITGAPQSNNTLHQAQEVGVQHKALVVPRAFALLFDAGVALDENRAVNDAWSHVLVPYAGLTAEVQAAPFVTVLAAVSGQVPAQYSGANLYTSTLSIGGGLIVTIDRDWDFYGHAGYVDVTRNFKFPYIDLGIARRFGR